MKCTVPTLDIISVQRGEVQVLLQLIKLAGVPGWQAQRKGAPPKAPPEGHLSRLMEEQ